MLPLPLRQAWLSSAAVPESGVPVVVVDRRAVSIETKRALERMPSLKFRQGLVTDLKLGPSSNEDPQSLGGSKEERTAPVAAGTVFGESFEADAVILAVGLGLGGSIAVGADSLQGGRYGETPADGLRSALEALGVVFGAVGLEVGARFGGDRAGLIDSVAEADPSHRRRRTIDIRRLAREKGLSGSGTGQAGLEWARRVAVKAFSSGFSTGDKQQGDTNDADCSSGSWPGSYPPAVHWREDLPLEEMIIGEGGGQVQVPLICADGRATAEIHLSPEGERSLRAAVAKTGGGYEADDRNGAVASRLHHVVRALVVRSLGSDGRLTLGSEGKPPVWVVGRAAGASSYLSSLRSGAVTGAAVAHALLKGGGEGQRADGSPQRKGLNPPESGEVPPGPVATRKQGSTA